MLLVLIVWRVWVLWAVAGGLLYWKLGDVLLLRLLLELVRVRISIE